VPEGRGRTGAEREAARRERANRRARRGGRPEPYPDVDPETGAEPDGQAPPDTAVEPPAVESPAAESPAAEPPAAEPLIATRSEPEPEPEAEPEPEPAPEPEPESTPGPEAESRPQPPAERPIKSFPSPPDPEFYVPDAQLETPSGTRRVSRGSRGRAGAGRRAPITPARRSRAHRPRRSGRRWLGRVVALIMLLLAAAIAWFAIELFQPFGVSPHGRVTVRIPERMSSDTVARLLASHGVIASRFFFEVRATLDGDRRDIRAGTYHLQRGMSYEAVLAKLTTIPKAAPTSEVTIAEGHTRQYVAKLLHDQHISGDYLAATRHSKLLDPRHYGAPKSTDTLEGFLFPDTFQLRDPINVSALVADQLKDFKRRFATLDLSVPHRHHLSAYDVVTIASLIEGESATAHDDRLISSVIYNRLRDHIMLGLDSTTRYATGNFTGPLTSAQLASHSPYNTRNHYGLPPGPINSPGLTALRAAADPARSHYLYFFTKPCSHHAVFASSYAQFNLLLIRDRRTHCPG
jgi:UPF0755 protein